MMKYIKKYKLQILVGIIISFLATSILFSQFININNLRKIKNLSFEVSDSINEASYGDQIRIYEIQSTDGVSLDLNKISEDTDWQYDVDLNTLCYYDSGSRKINIDTQEWFGQYVDGCSITVLKQPSSGILNVYCDDSLIKTMDLYSENWELETISVQGERNIGLARLIFTAVWIVCFMMVGTLVVSLDCLVKKKAERKRAVVILIADVTFVLAISVGYFLYYDVKYPEIVLEQDALFGKDNENLKDFEVTEEGLYSTSDDPWISYSYEKKLPVKIIEFNYSDIKEQGLWGEIYDTDTWSCARYFITDKHTYVEYGKDVFIQNFRFDLVTSAEKYIPIESIIINPRHSIVIRLFEYLRIVLASLVLLECIIYLYIVSEEDYY